MTTINPLIIAALVDANQYNIRDSGGCIDDTEKQIAYVKDEADHLQSKQEIKQEGIDDFSTPITLKRPHRAGNISTSTYHHYLNFSHKKKMLTHHTFIIWLEGSNPGGVDICITDCTFN